MDTTQFNGGFFLTISGIIITFLTFTLRMCLMSKCKTCSLCFGIIKIERDIEAELQEEKLQIENNINPLK
jgi:hypothetical protein